MKFFLATLMLFAFSITTVSAQGLLRDRSNSQRRGNQGAASNQSSSDQESSNQGESSKHAEGNNLDHQIAACLLLGNQEEIALAEFAEQHAQHDDVKAFAKMLADEHTKAVEKIQKAAPEVAHLKLTMKDRNQSDSESKSEGDNRGMAMLEKVKSECLSLTEQELGEQHGADFDKAYIGQQLGAHVAMLAELRGSKSFASQELQSIISEGEKMTLAHMEKAKEIMGKLKEDRDTKSAERSTNSSTR